MRLHWVLRVHLSESVCLKFVTISCMNSGTYRWFIHDFITQGVRKKSDTEVFFDKIGNKRTMSKIQISLYSKSNGKTNDA